MNTSEFHKKLNSLPKQLQKEVEDFVDFLDSKNQKAKETIQKRKAGLAKGMISIDESFDDPLEDFSKYIK